MNDELLAVVSMKEEAVQGDVPIFRASSEEEMIKMSQTLANILKGMVHEISQGVYIIVRH